MSSSIVSKDSESQVNHDLGKLFLEFECHEPEGVFHRQIHLMPFSRENLLAFWERVRKYPILFGVEISDSFERFTAVFLGQTHDGSVYTKGIVYILDNFVGAFYLTDIGDTEATIHFTFLDGRIRGRLPLAKATIKKVFEVYNFHRLNAALPTYVNEFTIEFVRKLGFIEEGIRRKSVKYHKYPDRWYNLIEYGILRDEVISNTQENINGSND